MSKFAVPTEYCLSEPENYYVDLQVSSLTPHASSPAGYLLAFRDISIRKQTELQLKKANASLQKQIQETNRLQEMLKSQATHAHFSCILDLANGAAHQLRGGRRCHCTGGANFALTAYFRP